MPLLRVIVPEVRNLKEIFIVVPECYRVHSDSESNNATVELHDFLKGISPSTRGGRTRVAAQDFLGASTICNPGVRGMTTPQPAWPPQGSIGNRSFVAGQLTGAELPGTTFAAIFQGEMPGPCAVGERRCEQRSLWSQGIEEGFHDRIGSAFDRA